MPAPYTYQPGDGRASALRSVGGLRTAVPALLIRGVMNELIVALLIGALGGLASGLKKWREEMEGPVPLSVQLVNHALRGVNEQLTIGAAESSSLD